MLTTAAPPGTQDTFVRAGLLAAPPPRAPPPAGAPARAAAGTPGASFLQPQAGDWRVSGGQAKRISESPGSTSKQSPGVWVGGWAEGLLSLSHDKG